ncbi:uncharacterized protein LOC121766847 [Salvia splendens]|uniref:uncharacterized protein LOC121766847 n=1 Tax=Salvia splendens TaxID=180675 RepID=UPI001C26641C|nr:uncharacterized protein LOC121766847 [Salvia splendens]
MEDETRVELEKLQILVNQLIDGPRVDANNFELRIPLIQGVEQHHLTGRATEDANRHLLKFVEIANTLKLNGVDDDTIRVRLFPFSLIDSAKEWFECLPTEQVSTWKDIVAAFLDKYYPPDTILKLKTEIFQFMQGHDEPLYEAVARFKGILCGPSGANGGFLRKSGADAVAVIEEFATNSRGWSKERHNSRRVAAINETEESSFAKELAELGVRVDQMDTSRKEDPVPPTSGIAVTKPNTPSASTEDVNYVQQGGGPNRPYNNNYRPSQRAPLKKEEKYDQGIMKILKVLVQDRKTNDTKIGVVEAMLNNLEAEINIIVTVVTNIKNQMDQKIEVGSTTVTCSGVCPDAERNAAEQAEAPTKDGLVWHNGYVFPFQPKRKFKLEEQFKHFLNMFCKVHTNIPLVDSLQEIPRYAKLLREAVMKKKKLTKADLKLPHHCSAIIQKEKAVKQRDFDKFIIRCSIGQGKVDKALCDLGASIHIMPLKYYENLNIRPLKTSDVIIRLADNTAIKTMGMIEDVLVNVDDFIFPTDFIILDMKVDKNVPLILGRDFLAICKALIDVGRGEITTSDNYSRSTYKIDSAMLKYEEAQQAKMEPECRVVMMIDHGKPKLTKAPSQEKQKKKKKKAQPQANPEIYVIKTSKGKYKWWKKLSTKLVPFAVFSTRVVDPHT